MSGMDRYRTRTKANSTKRIPLYDPATGKPTEDWIEIRSSMSDAFKHAKNRAMQEASDFAASAGDEDERNEALAQVQARMHASLVADWSFDEPCTPANVAAFLLESPHVTALVVGIADRGELFFGGASES